MNNAAVAKFAIIIIMGLFFAACSNNDWRVQATPTEAAVATALDDVPDPAVLTQVDLPHQPLMSLPKKVRPCCAFGYNQKVNMANLPVPFVRIANTVALQDIGAHAYEAGTFSFQRPAPDASRRTEANGLIYTLRGGFIDLAHVRDTADNTVALFYHIHPRLGQAQTIKLPYEIGERYIELSAFDVSGLTAEQKWQLAANMGARLAYFMAEAHELAQWHGYRTYAPWSEDVSAYSPEDIYSNMLGAKIALAVIVNNQAMTRQQFNFHMTSWLESSLTWLQPVSKSHTNALLDVVDGMWWDSKARLPNKFFVLLRHYQLGDQQQPYLVPEQLASQSEQWSLVADLYQNAKPQHDLSLASSLFGIDFDEVAKQWLFVDDKFASSFEHVPETLWQQGFTQTQFRMISQFNAKEDQRQLQEWLTNRPYLIGPEAFQRLPKPLPAHKLNP
ncbi:DUF4056 domain-containing protein [Shewanella maritima]|uniref:DUF4056 domain-containing protein n=1 Tax=Shewanella maritima TaxID=2520507 RepID=UPI0037362917